MQPVRCSPLIFADFVRLSMTWDVRVQYTQHKLNAVDLLVAAAGKFPFHSMGDVDGGHNIRYLWVE